MAVIDGCVHLSLPVVHRVSFLKHLIRRTELGASCTWNADLHEALVSCRQRDIKTETLLGRKIFRKRPAFG